MGCYGCAEDAGAVEGKGQRGGSGAATSSKQTVENEIIDAQAASGWTKRRRRKQVECSRGTGGERRGQAESRRQRGGQEAAAEARGRWTFKEVERRSLVSEAGMAAKAVLGAAKLVVNPETEQKQETEVRTWTFGLSSKPQNTQLENGKEVISNTSNENRQGDKKLLATTASTESKQLRTAVYLMWLSKFLLTFSTKVENKFHRPNK